MGHTSQKQEFTTHTKATNNFNKQLPQNWETQITDDFPKPIFQDTAQRIYLKTIRVENAPVARRAPHYLGLYFVHIFNQQKPFIKTCRRPPSKRLRSSVQSSR